jgi:hypothetical protein
MLHGGFRTSAWGGVVRKALAGVAVGGLALCAFAPAAGAAENLVIATSPTQVTTIPLTGVKSLSDLLAAVCEPIETQAPIDGQRGPVCSSQSVGWGPGPSGSIRNVVVVPGVAGVATGESHWSATGSTYALGVLLGSAAH